MQLKQNYRCFICGARVKRARLAAHHKLHQVAACKAIRSSMGSLRRGFAVNGVIEEPDVKEELDGLGTAIALIRNPMPFKL